MTLTINSKTLPGWITMAMSIIGLMILPGIGSYGGLQVRDAKLQGDLQNVCTRVDGRIDLLDAKLSGRVDTLSQTNVTLHQAIDTRISACEGSQLRVEGRVERAEQRVAGLEARQASGSKGSTDGGSKS